MWESVKLSEIVTFVRGLTYSKKDEVDANGLAVLRATNVSLEHHKITLDEIRYIKTPVKLNEDKLVKVGDILMCTASGSKSHLGKCALVKEDLGMAFGGFMAALRCKSSCLPEYLFYILTSNLFFKRLSSLSDGASINNLKFSQIEDFEFPLPSLTEQQRIVAKLDAAFAEIDEAIEISKLQAGSTNSLKSQFISDALTMNSQTIPLGDCCSFLNGYAFKSKEAVETSETQLLRMGNLYENKLDLERKPVFYPDEYANQYSRYVLAEDDIVMTLTGTVGKKDYGYALKIKKQEKKLLLNQRILKLYDFKNTIINQEYLLYFLRSESFLSELYSTSNGTRQANLSSDTIKKLKIPVPSLDEQEKLVSAFKLIDGYHNQLFECLVLKALNLSKLKSAILKQELQSSEAA